MTARKHFKQLVRDRMRRTGEKYTVARRHIEGDSSWELRGGIEGDTAAFANVLANLGVEHDGAPLSEAMILGVGGGLGAGYILWEFQRNDYRGVVFGFRRLWQYPDRWATETAARLGLHASVHETGGVRSAATALASQLDQGLPAIVWVDDERLGLKGEPPWREGHGGPPVVVYGRTGDSYLIDDRSSGRATVNGEVLAEARGRVVSYKNRLIAIDPERVDLDLIPAVQEGLRLQVAHLSEKSDSFSLPAWAKWARMVNDTRNKKAWPNVFADGRGTASLRASIYTNASGGANLRGLYASFLEEASALLGVELPSEEWRTAARAWDAIVDAALPPGDELRAAIDTAAAQWRRGDTARDEMLAAASRRWALQAERDESGELPAVADVVAEMHAAEVDALEALRRAV